MGTQMEKQWHLKLFLVLALFFAKSYLHAQEYCDYDADPDCLCGEDDGCGVDAAPPPRGGDGGGPSCATAAADQFAYYNDYSEDASGNVDVWTYTYNNLNTPTEGLIKATLNLTLPNGTVMPAVVGSTSSTYLVSASATFSSTNMSDAGLGSITNTHEIDWNCGIDSLSTIKGKIGISQRTFKYNSMSTTPTGASQCVYTLACPAGQTPTCSTSTFYVSPPCYETYINDSSVYVVYGSTLSCFGIGQAIPTYTQGVCN